MNWDNQSFFEYGWEVALRDTQNIYIYIYIYIHTHTREGIMRGMANFSINIEILSNEHNFLGFKILKVK